MLAPSTISRYEEPMLRLNLITGPRKRCAKCGRKHPLEFFHKRSAALDGLHPQCKNCVLLYNQSYIQDPEVAARRAEYMASYREEHAEEIAASTRKYRQENSEEVSAALRAWRAANPEKVEAVQRRRVESGRAAADAERYRERNPEKIRTYSKQYYEKHREQLNEDWKAWHRANRDQLNQRRREKYRRDYENPVFKLDKRIRVLLRSALRRLGKAKPDSTWSLLPYTPAELAEHLSKFTACPRCGRGFPSLSHAQIDHIIPMATAKTLDDVLELNALSNLQLLCGPCNLRKGSKIGDE